MRHGAVLANDFFSESYQRRNWNETQFACYASAKSLQFDVIETAYTSRYHKNEGDLLARLVTEGKAAAAYTDPDQRFTVYDLRPLIRGVEATPSVSECGLMSRLEASRLTAAGLTIAADSSSRRLLLIVFCLDAPFAFVFLVALQSYFTPQEIAGRAVAGLALSLYAAGKLALQYQGGKLSDRWGSTRSLRLGQACIAVALISLLATPSLPVLVLPASAAYGAGSALAWPALLSHARTAPVSLRATLTAAITVASGAGLAAAFLLGFVLPENLPFDLAIALSLLAAAAGLALSSNIPAGAPALQPVRQGRGILSAVLADRARLGLGAAFFFQSLASRRSLPASAHLAKT